MFICVQDNHPAPPFPFEARLHPHVGEVAPTIAGMVSDVEQVGQVPVSRDDGMERVIITGIDNLLLKDEMKISDLIDLDILSLIYDDFDFEKDRTVSLIVWMDLLDKIYHRTCEILGIN